MVDDERLSGDSAALPEGWSGVPLALKALDGEEKGFAVRHGGAVCAFVNRCPHMGTELDWQPGEFFEEGGLYLVCSTHGAIFEPRTRFCVSGPSRAASLEPLEVREIHAGVFLLNDNPPPTKTRMPDAS